MTEINRYFGATEEHHQWRTLAVAGAAGALALYWTYKRFSSNTAPKAERLQRLQQDAAVALEGLSPAEQEDAAERAREITEANLRWGK
jgi:hypothetical protein